MEETEEVDGEESIQAVGGQVDEGGGVGQKLKMHEAMKIAAEEASVLQRNSHLDVFASLDAMTVVQYEYAYVLDVKDGM